VVGRLLPQGGQVVQQRGDYRPDGHTNALFKKIRDSFTRFFDIGFSMSVQCVNSCFVAVISNMVNKY